MESVTARETDLFLPRVPLSKQIIVLYMLIHHNQPGIEKLAFDANMDEHCVNTLVGKAQTSLVVDGSGQPGPSSGRS